MACIIASGRETSCKDAVGGIKGVYIHNYTEWYNNSTTTINSNDEIENIGDVNLSGDAKPFNVYYFQVRREMCKFWR